MRKLLSAGKRAHFDLIGIAISTIPEKKIQIPKTHIPNIDCVVDFYISIHSANETFSQREQTTAQQLKINIDSGVKHTRTHIRNISSLSQTHATHNR